jgi:uncharacterized Zn finger protein/superfamily II DNA or RNA helicase
VLSLKIEARRVSARVKGHYRSSYTVIIDFPPLKEKDRVLELIGRDPALLAGIAAGDLPEAFLQTLKDSGISLIPARWGDMVRVCSCPDYGDPCKHMAALYFILAKEVDADPHLLFRLRGIDLSGLTKQLGGDLEHRIEAPFEIKAAAKGGPREGSGKGRDDGADAPRERPVITGIPQCADLICSLLPPAPPFADRDFAEVMAEFYRHAARFIPWPPSAEDGGEEHVWSRSRWTIECFRPRPGAEVFLLRETIRGEKTRYSLLDAFRRFRDFSADDGSESYVFLFYLFKLLNLLCTAGAVIPRVFADGTCLKIIWKPFDRLPQIADMLSAIARRGERMLPLPKRGRASRGSGKNPKHAGGAAAGDSDTAAGHAAGVRAADTDSDYADGGYADGAGAVQLLSSAFLGEWVRSSNVTIAGGGAAFRDLVGIFFRGEEMDTGSPALRSLPLAIDRWLSVLHADFGAYRYRFNIKTSGSRSPRPAGGAAEDLSDFVLSIEAARDVPDVRDSPAVRAAPGGIKFVPLKDAARTLGGIAALRAPTALSNYLPEIRTLFSHREIRLTEQHLINFLDSGAELLTRLGLEVILPKSLHRELKPRLVLQAKGTGKAQGSLVRYFDLNSLLDWQWQIAIGDELVSPEEFAVLVKGKKRLVKFRDLYIHIDPAELARLLKKSREDQPTVNELLKSHFAGDSFLSFDAEAVIKNLFAERNFEIPKNLNAVLRPYQERGYNWICSLLYAGFGCVLADDMGLGKTVQAITVLLRLKADKLLTGQALVVAPAALLENWERELSRFAPDLAIARYHGAGRTLHKKSDVFLTTYQTASRDREKLVKHPFSMLIADEAHLMKNAATEGARTLRQLRSPCRLALSGTPVENRLEDMRSLFDFVLPGYLGTPAQFKETYRLPIEVQRSKAAADTLKKITAPFLLRRLKSDKAIIADLPEKITINEYSALVKDQLALYETVVSHTMGVSEKLENPLERSALVLKLLTSLKQICGHPRVFDKESPAVSRLSGKAALLLTLLEEIIANREKTLIFSQYVETLHCLDIIIREELGELPLIYHGGLRQKQRSDTIDIFQNDPSRRILLISLKAGGLGLNLTAASRVIHYDLWYNPAVENQATDRVFRIGQSRKVFVHRFIAKNSFEEKIDRMLTDKQELADMTVSSGESWLSRMSHAELRNLFAGTG